MVFARLVRAHDHPSGMPAQVAVQHFCFRVGQKEFDAILGRIKAAAIKFRSTVRGLEDMQVGKEYGNIYWNEPDGHQWEILTVSDARPA